MNKENCALKLVDEIILYYDARSKKHQMISECLSPCCLNFHISLVYVEHEQNLYVLLNCNVQLAVSPLRWCLWTPAHTAMFGKPVTVNSCSQVSTLLGAS